MTRCLSVLLGLVLSLQLTESKIDKITYANGWTRAVNLPKCHVCGNNVQEAGEQCDDGNTAGADGCSEKCRLEISGHVVLCGNNQLDLNEECDDGSTHCAGCALATTATHGNGARETGEACDDGNMVSGDGCYCTAAGCALEAAANDGMVEDQEDCDDMNHDDFDGCKDQMFSWPDPAASSEVFNGNSHNRFCPSAFDPTAAGANGWWADARMWARPGETAQAPRPPALPAVPESVNTIYAIRTTEPQYAEGDYTYTLSWDKDGFLPQTAIVETNTFQCVLTAPRPALVAGRPDLVVGTYEPEVPTACDPTVAASCANADPLVTACMARVEAPDALAADPDCGSFGCDGMCVVNNGATHYDWSFSNHNGFAACNKVTPVACATGSSCVTKRLRFSQDNFHNAGGIRLCPYLAHGFCANDPTMSCTADGVAGGCPNMADGTAVLCSGFCAGSPTTSCTSATAAAGTCGAGVACQYASATTTGNGGDDTCRCTLASAGGQGYDAKMDGDNFILPVEVATSFRDIQTQKTSRAYRYSHSVKRQGLINHQPFRICARMSQNPANTDVTHTKAFDTGYNLVVTEGCNVDADCMAGTPAINLQAGGVTAEIEGLSDFANTVQHRTSCVALDSSEGVRGVCVDPNDRVVLNSVTNLYNPIVERSCPNSVSGGSNAFVNLLPARDSRRNFALSLYGRVQDFEVVYGRGVFDLLTVASPCACSSGNDCSAGETCCKRTKFNEVAQASPNDRLRHLSPLASEDLSSALSLVKQWSLISRGTCYNIEKQGCCDNGYIYNKVTEHCCQLGGVLPIDMPCPCASPEHCQNPDSTVGGNQHMTCCMQQFPVVDATCDYFANWPHATRTSHTWTGTPGADATGDFVDRRSRTSWDAEKSGLFGLWEKTYHDLNGDFNYLSQGIARPAIRDAPFCPGRCVDTRLEICCNGLPCNAHYERCCNSTCCNKYSESCKETSVAFGHAVPLRKGLLKTFWADIPRWSGLRQTARGDLATTGDREGALPAVDNAAGDYDVKFEVCVGREETITITVFFWTVFLPVLFVITSALCIWICAFWVLRATDERSDGWGRLIVLCAILQTLFLAPLYFSPLFNYPLIGTAVAVFTILIGGTCRSRSHKLTLIAIILNAVFGTYLLDPFNGNEILSFSRTPFGSMEERTSALFHDTSFCPDSMKFPGCSCVEFYHGYFAEPLMYSNQRDAFTSQSYLMHQLPQRTRDLDFTHGGSQAVGNDWTKNTHGFEAEEVEITLRNVDPTGTQTGRRWSRSIPGGGMWGGMQTWGYCDRNWIGFTAYSALLGHCFQGLATVLLVLVLTISVRKDQVRKFREVEFNAHEDHAAANSAHFVESWDGSKPVPEYN